MQHKMKRKWISFVFLLVVGHEDGKEESLVCKCCSIAVHSSMIFFVIALTLCYHVCLVLLQIIAKILVQQNALLREINCNANRNANASCE